MHLDKLANIRLAIAATAARLERFGARIEK